MASSSKKVILVAMAGNSLIAITKFIASAITGSSAMLSEGIHSVVDTSNQVLLLYGLHCAKKPADENFPFGHGKEIYFWSFVVAILLFSIGAGVSVYEGLHRIFHPAEIANPVINYIVLGLAIVFESGSLFVAIKEFAKVKGDLGYFEAVHNAKDPSLFVVLFEDIAAILGLVIAFLGILIGHLTGNPYMDGLASMMIGLILGGTAIILAYETKSLLIGESANKEVVEKIKVLVEKYQNVEHVNEILTMHMGPDYILVNLSVDFSDTILVGVVEDTITKLSREIKTHIPEVKRIFVEAEARKE